MDPAQFLTESRVVIVAGKGGVGKTTVTAALARTAALAGLTTLVVEVEGKSGMATLYGQPPFAYDEVVLSPGGPGGAVVRSPRPLVEAPSGVYGDPGPATAALGDLILAESSAALATWLERG